MDKLRLVLRQNILKIMVIALVLMALTIRFILARPVYKSGDNIKVTAVILNDPKTAEYYQTVRISGLTILLPEFPVVHYGDKITVTGMVEEGEVVKKPILINIESETLLLSDLRNRIIEFYQKNLPEPQAGILSGITLGAKSALDRDFYFSAKQAGVAHIVVASGTNIAFVSSFLLLGFSALFKRKKTIYIVILGIILYIFLSGFDAPLIRAGIMSLALLLGNLTGRIVNKWSVFTGTAALMLFIYPLWLSDLGFWLSFSATLGLLIFTVPLSRKLARLPSLIKESITTTLSAQVFVYPVLFFSLGVFNPLSIIANLLILWTVPFVMVFGAAAGLIGLVAPVVGRIFLWLSYPLLSWIAIVTANVTI